VFTAVNTGSLYRALLGITFQTEDEVVTRNGIPVFTVLLSSRISCFCPSLGRRAAATVATSVEYETTLGSSNYRI